MFGGEPIYGKLDGAMIRVLADAPSVFFVTLDDDVAGFAAVAAKRRLAKRPTAGLLLRPQSCFARGPVGYVKHALFRTLKSLRGVTIATITPFDVAPAYAKVASIGLADPQYWDLLRDGHAPPPASTPLSHDVVQRAQGRPIIAAVGSLNPEKGLEHLAAALEQCRSAHHIGDDAFVVFAGRVLPGSEAIAKRLDQAGALVVDRFISDDELSSLYGIADAVWACYAPAYDQASGIFGRAIQTGVPAILRRGSVISQIAANNDFAHYAIDGHDISELAQLLQKLPRRAPADCSSPAREKLLSTWRGDFIDRIRAGLAG